MELYTIHNENCHEYPIIISIPHSGTCIPDDIKESMLGNVVLPNMDWFLNELYSFLYEMNITVISSNISRYVIDLNRDKFEDLNGNDFSDTLVYSHNTFGKPLYSNKLSQEEIQNRIVTYYDPYHLALTELIKSKLKVFKTILLLDMHSFSIDFEDGCNEDISLSNYENISSTTESINLLSEILKGQGYKIGINVIRGRYILKNYKQLFGNKINCIQMELRYSKYIDDRYFDEEELYFWNEEIFSNAQNKLKKAFTNLTNKLRMV